MPLDGSAPALLYGYGSYEISIDPSFSIPRLSLLDRGFVYAIAHVRGGGELGRAWYENGKTLTKKNTFTDFVAAADFLVEHGYTSRDRLAAAGGSAGGMLMGAVANLAPERFRAIHAAVPFVDALTTILDPDLPLTVIEWEEWGDPLHDPEVYAYMKSYSPYENVEARRYPAILATTSLNDTRVFYVEPAKWVAALRHGRHQRRRPADPAEDRDGRRARRGQRPLQGLAGEGLRVRVDHRPGRRGLEGYAGEGSPAGRLSARLAAEVVDRDEERRPGAQVADHAVEGRLGQVDPVQDLATRGDPDAAARSPRRPARRCRRPGRSMPSGCRPGVSAQIRRSVSPPSGAIAYAVSRLPHDSATSSVRPSSMTAIPLGNASPSATRSTRPSGRDQHDETHRPGLVRGDRAVVGEADVVQVRRAVGSQHDLVPRMVTEAGQAGVQCRLLVDRTGEQQRLIGGGDQQRPWAGGGG